MIKDWLELAYVLQRGHVTAHNEESNIVAENYDIGNAGVAVRVTLTGVSKLCCQRRTRALAHTLEFTQKSQLTGRKCPASAWSINKCATVSVLTRTGR